MSRATRTVLLTLLALCAMPVASAFADRSFAPRYQVHTRGNLTMAANTLLSCPTGAANCDNARNGVAGAPTNNSWTMSWVDSDADVATFDSSSAHLSLPAGATVTFAGLYWGADTVAGATGADAPAPAFASTALLQTPGSSGYAQVNADQLDWASGSWSARYQSFADVTAQVAAAGTGDYTLANVQASTGNDRYAGWTLVVAYRLAGDPVRNLSVYDGLVTMQSGATDITLDGFETPGSGTVAAKLGLVSYEGDLGLTGDTVRLNGTALSDGLNPSNNFFNGSITDSGTRVSSKSPDYVNQLGLDADTVSVDGLIPAGATSADLQVSSAGDTYFVGVAALATDQVVEAPSNTGAPGMSGTEQDGQTLTADPGTWGGTQPMDFAYQWQRCDASGANCSDIAGATGSTYQLGEDDAGHTVRVVVTATNEQDSQSATSPASGVIAAVAPSHSGGAPAVSGPAQAGDTLTAPSGNWSGTGPFDITYQWQRCDAAGANCVDIAGATDPTYGPTADDVGSTIVVVVTATNPAGSDTVTSAPSAVIAAPAQAGQPAESGDAPDFDAADNDPGELVTLAPNSCRLLTGTQVLAFQVPTIHFRIRVAPSGQISAANPLRAASPVSFGNRWKLNRYVRQVTYRLNGKRIAVRRRAPYAVRITPAMMSSAARQVLTVRVAGKRGKPRVARVALNSKPCSELFSVVHRPSPRASLLGLRVDSVSPLHTVSFRVPARLLAKRGTRGVAGKLRVRFHGQKAVNYRLSFPRHASKATTLLAGAGRPQVRVSGGRITVSGLPTGAAGIRLRLRGRGMLRTPRAKLRAVVESDAGTRRLAQRLGRRR
jgi:hypothetical protein